MADSSPSIDVTMLELFTSEVEQQSLVMVDALLKLEKDVADTAMAKDLMRAAHSLKGAARLLNVTGIEQISHVMEEIFLAAQEQKQAISPNHVDRFLSAVDMIKAIAALPPEKMLSWHSSNENELKLLVESLEGLEHEPVSEQPIAAKPQVDDAKPEDKASVPPMPAAGERRSGIRISNAKLENLIINSSELLVQHKWIETYLRDLILQKKRNAEVNKIIENLREHVGEGLNVELHYSMLTETSSRLREISSELNQGINDIYEFHHRTGTVAETLNRDILSTRMRPFSEGLGQFPRMVRDIARSLGKKVELVIHGGNTEVDRDVLDLIEAPLTHLIRNAIDHGIEKPAARKKAGKAEIASIKLSAGYYNGMLQIQIQDDGQGIDHEVIRKRVVKRKLASEEVAASMNRDELLEFLFLPQFSTRDRATKISGRGIGLDVVKDVVNDLKGYVSVTAEVGVGTLFKLQLPVSVSVISALLVEVDGEPYAFPLARVERVLKVDQDDIFYMEGHQYINHEEERIGLISGRQVLGRPSERYSKQGISIIIIHDYLSRYGLVVDAVSGQKELVLQALDDRLGNVPDISATALMEDGTPTLILDVDDLVRSIDYLIKGGNIKQISMEEDLSYDRKRILVVDDSITVREVERNLLSSQGYDVSVAVDGLDGWNAIRTGDFDLLITDIDMPRMDGFELVTLVKSDNRLQDLPTMIVSYKDREEDRRRGLEIGADYYLTKGSFHDETLIDAVKDLIGDSIKE